MTNRNLTKEFKTILLIDEFISEGIKDYLVLLFFWMFGMPLLVSIIYMFMVYINN